MEFFGVEDLERLIFLQGVCGLGETLFLLDGPDLVILMPTIHEGLHGGFHDHGG